MNARTLSFRPLFGASLLLLAHAKAGLSGFTGLWDADGSLAARYDCQPALAAAGWTPVFAPGSIGGQSATVLAVPALGPAQTLGFAHSASPNGGAGATRLNQWTLVMDMRPQVIANYTSLLQTNPANTDDADAWISANGSLAFGGAAAPAGTFTAGTWYRLALTVENNGSGGGLTTRAYINGALTGSGTSLFNGNHSVAGTLLLFSDNNAETRPVEVNGLGFWPETLSPADIATLGGPAAPGLIGSWNVDPCAPGSTIQAAARFAWSGNTGWLCGNWDPAASPGGRGVVITPWLCRGEFWSANLGWLAVGNGTPASGIRYSQTGGEWGVNHDGSGALYGYAWSANAGWVYFGKHPLASPTDRWPQNPRVDLRTGRLYGMAWSGNTGWVHLGTSAAASLLATDFASCGDDTDHDGLPDPWEREKLIQAGLPSSLTTLRGPRDSDGDGQSDATEYAADTSPVNAADRHSILTVTKTAGVFTANWPSRSSRLYRLESTPDLLSWDISAAILPGTGSTLTGTGPASGPERFYRVRAWSPFCPDPP